MSESGAFFSTETITKDEREAVLDTTTLAPRRGIAQECQPLFFDLETVPDSSRLSLFTKPTYNEYPPRVPVELCEDSVEFLKGVVGDLEAAIMKYRPCDEYLEQLVRLEANASKPRKTAIEVIRKCGRALKAQDEEFTTYCKTLSIVPEYCSIAAMGWAVGSGPVYSMVVGTDDDTEVDILRQFWNLAAVHSPIVGFNIIGFDLMVIAIRTAILGLSGGFPFDTRPWNRKVIDLFERRYGHRFPSSNEPGQLKELAGVMGIPIPAGDMEGSQVYDTFLATPDKLHEYVQSDVAITRELYARYIGILF